MRFGRSRAFLLAALVCAAWPVGSAAGKLRLADAATDACLLNCENENTSCKRICPTTFGAPCLNSCDARTQTCRLNCQRK
jgi:hypothetical protein